MFKCLCINDYPRIKTIEVQEINTVKPPNQIYLP